MAKTGSTLMTNDIPAHFKASTVLGLSLKDSSTITTALIKNGFNMPDISRAVLSLIIPQMIY
jgi:hypothetical protein